MDEVHGLTCSSDSEEEEEEDEDDELDDTASLATSIAELTSEINIKQQLVEQLERAQQSMFTLRAQYEEKLTSLQQQIKVTENERDRVIKEMCKPRGGCDITVGCHGNLMCTQLRLGSHEPEMRR